MLAAGIPLVDIVVTLVYLFVFVMFVWLVITMLIDVFRSDDLSGWGKAGWTLLLILLPFIGAIVYLTVRGSGMADRAYSARKRHEIESSMAGATTAEQLEKLADLRDRGVISEDEFQRLKADALPS